MPRGVRFALLPSGGGPHVGWVHVARASRVAVAALLLVAACSNSKLHVAVATPCATPGVDLVAHFKRGVTDKQISDYGASLDAFKDANHIPEHIRIVSDTHADYAARTLSFNFCKSASSAAIERFRTLLLNSKLISGFSSK